MTPTLLHFSYMHTQLEAAFKLQFAVKVAELEQRGHSFDTFEQDACLMLASLVIKEVPLLCRGRVVMQCKKSAAHAHRSNTKRAISHQLWCKLSVKLHGQCDVCEGSQGQYRDLPRVGSDHVSNERGSWCLYCYALQSQFTYSP